MRFCCKTLQCWAHVCSYLSTACLVCGFNNPPSHWTMKVSVWSCRVVTSLLTFWKCVSELWGSPHTPCLPVLMEFTLQRHPSPWLCLQPPSGVRRGGECQVILGAPFLVTPYPLRGHDLKTKQCSDTQLAESPHTHEYQCVHENIGICLWGFVIITMVTSFSIEGLGAH